MARFTFKVLLIVLSFNFAHADRGDMPIWGSDVDLFQANEPERLALNDTSSGVISSQSEFSDPTGNLEAQFGDRVQGILTGKIVFNSMNAPIVGCLIRLRILTGGAYRIAEGSASHYTEFGPAIPYTQGNEVWSNTENHIIANENGTYEFDYWMPFDDRAKAEDLAKKIKECEGQNEGDSPLIGQDSHRVNPRIVPASLRSSEPIRSDVTEI